MNNNNNPRSNGVLSSKLWQILIVFMLVVTVDARLRENYAELMVSCDDSAMNVRMNFKYPFRGIVFIPEHYYDPTCSYGVSPNSTATQITLTLPHDSCKMRVLNSSNKLIGFNTIVVFHHRMLETVYDYTQNVSCDLKYAIKDLNKDIWHEPRLKTWISFENAPSILPEHIVDKMGLTDALLLVYHVKDQGMNQDMVVMNCIGHDAGTVDERTTLYQLSNPFGCSSKSDLVSNFTVFRNTIGDANMIAYATIKNFSMVVRRRLYITCGAKLCKDRCERNCLKVDQQRRFYFSDIVTKGLVNRPKGSRRPASLTAFERFDRHRRSHNNTELFSQNATEEQSEFLVEKLNAFSSCSVIQPGTGTNETFQICKNDTTPLLLDSKEHVRSKRAIKQLKTKPISSEMNVIVMKANKTVDLEKYSVKVLSTSVTDAEGFEPKNSSDLCETESVVKVKMTFEPQHSSRINGENKSERFNFSSFLRVLVAIFALICISGACYSLFSFKSHLDTVSVSDYASQSYI